MIPARPKVVATPSQGGSVPAGKSDAPNANLGRHAVTTVSVRQASEDAGAAQRCIDKQVGANGNPKKRPAAHWGIPDEK